MDGITWRHGTARNLEGNLRDLSGRLKRGAYRAKPVRRAFIAQTRRSARRPLGVTCAGRQDSFKGLTVKTLNAIYETDFLGFSYGFRPKRNQHQALDALYVGQLTKKVNWVLDADITGFFRCHRPGMAGEVRRAPNCGSAHRTFDQEMVERGCVRGRSADMRSEKGTGPGAEYQSALGQRLSSLRVRPLDPAMETDAGQRRRDRGQVRPTTSSLGFPTSSRSRTVPERS